MPALIARLFKVDSTLLLELSDNAVLNGLSIVYMTTRQHVGSREDLEIVLPARQKNTVIAVQHGDATCR